MKQHFFCVVNSLQIKGLQLREWGFGLDFLLMPYGQYKPLTLLSIDIVSLREMVASTTIVTIVNLPVGHRYK
ncbi:hypothetical protein [Pinibacter aurantiacus]|uniref:Uncharacterized protein n=1 Tax=Pinibacter aurantiacus TaxID=2851599 RepID=A0A9E2W252_9BACT|nr:hypothetical protein [Pinibacter aurantiacus]MBV4356925.1 hypothetical protein [Pinibacter aurantiacus]